MSLKCHSNLLILNWLAASNCHSFVTRLSLDLVDLELFFSFQMSGDLSFRLILNGFSIFICFSFNGRSLKCLSVSFYTSFSFVPQILVIVDDLARSACQWWRLSSGPSVSDIDGHGQVAQVEQG